MDGGGDQAERPVNIRPKNVYGLRSDVRGNIHFNSNNEVIYPVEGVLAFHDYVTNKQRFLRLPSDINLEIIIINQNRKLLATLEKNEKTGNKISIYDLSTLKKCRDLEIPENAKQKEVSQMQFSYDSRSVVLLTKPPNETLYILVMDKSGSIVEGRAANSNNRGTAEYIACNPQDKTLIAACGDSTVKFMCKAEKGFTTNMEVNCSYLVTSIAWLSADVLGVGTSNGEIILIEAGETKIRYVGSETNVIDLLADEPDVTLEFPLTPNYLKTEILCMTAFSTGLAYAQFNVVYVFQKVTKFMYERKTILQIPFTIYAKALYQIKNLAVDAKEETVIVTANHSQIYAGVLIVPETLRVKHLEFQPLGEQIHIAEIISVTICYWRPIIMTASKDQTIRIWNYDTEKVEMVKKYQVEVTVVELNPTGVLAAVGFSDQMRIMQIFMDELQIIKTYNFPRSRSIKYSNMGHLMAAAYDTSIAITSVFTLDILFFLKGHNGEVLALSWSKNDKYLVSGGAEGAVYQWDAENGERVQELVQKGIEYRSVYTTKSDPLSIYTATDLGIMREIQNSEIIREIPAPTKTKTALTDICLSRSDLILFAATESGNLYNIRLPFLDTGGGTCTEFAFFRSAITKMRYTYDDTLLITASKSGTLVIWVLENIANKLLALDKDLLKSQEILIPRAVLQDKNDQIQSLELRLKQQAAEFRYQMSQNEIFDEQAMADIHTGYCQALEDLKNKNSELEKRHVEDMNQVMVQMGDIKSEHKQQLDELATQYSERMLMEFQRFTKLRENMMEIRDSYEEKLRNSAGCLQDTVEALDLDFKKQLDERRELIRELMKEMQDKKVEFLEYCSQVEADNDRNMIETQISYENKLITEKEETLRWRGEAGVLTQKYNAMVKETDILLEEVETLKEEHSKSQRAIIKLNRDIEGLQKDISDRDYAINAKERRIHDLLRKNQELDKYKQVLAHKIAELKSQIEPREFAIEDKRRQIVELEQELNGLNQSNVRMEIQLVELRDKYIGNLTELKTERERAKHARELITNICSDIYHLAGNMNSQEAIKIGVKNLFLKYSNDKELKRFIALNEEVKAEFNRQRGQVEKIMETYKKKLADNTFQKRVAKLTSRNLALIQELDKLREDNETLRKFIPKTPKPRRSS